MHSISPAELLKIRQGITDIRADADRIFTILEQVQTLKHPAEVNLEQAIRDSAAKHPSVQDNAAGPAPVETDLGMGKTPDGIPRRLMPWGKRVSVSFLDKVLWIEHDLGLNANHLMNCMAFETGRTFSPSVKNPGSSATGLIQFMAATARRLDTTVEQLAQMTAENQLNYVWKYFEDYAGRMDLKKWNLGDTYMSILWPAGIGKTDSHPIFVQGRGTAYAANRGLDANKDGTVTRGECIAKIMQMQKEGNAAANFGYGNL